jgi:3-methyladenine DNA glycosylase/8-oxoguanine DNA glycosylase
MNITLPARQPFAFGSVVNSHGWVQLSPFSYNEEKAVLTYVDRLSNGHVLEYRITEAPGGVQVQTEKLSKAEKTEAAHRIAWMLGLDMDFSTFYKAARKEPKLAHVRKNASGRVLRSPTFFEDVVKTILTTNTVWGATKRMNINLINQFGHPLNGDESKRAFPEPASIAAASPAVLRESVRAGYRSPALHELAARVASGELDLESLKSSSLPTRALRDKLLEINGVGPYAAANLLMILGRHDFIPIDTWALKLVSQEWYRGRPITAKEVERRFEKWGEFKGLAFWFWDWKKSD